VPGGAFAGCDRRLVVAPDHPATRRSAAAASASFRRASALPRTSLPRGCARWSKRGILKTAPASDGSAYQEYVLTPKGRGVFPILVALRQWSETFDDAPEEIGTILVDREKGRPVRKLELHAQDGRLLDFGDIAIKPRPAAKLRRHARA